MAVRKDGFGVGVEDGDEEDGDMYIGLRVSDGPRGGTHCKNIAGAPPWSDPSSTTLPSNGHRQLPACGKRVLGVVTFSVQGEAMAPEGVTVAKSLQTPPVRLPQS